MVREAWVDARSVPVVARSGAQDDDDGVPRRVSGNKPRRSMFLTVCLVVTALMAIGALTVSIIAFAKAPHSHSHAPAPPGAPSDGYYDDDSSSASSVATAAASETSAASNTDDDFLSSVFSGDDDGDSASSVSDTSSLLPPPPPATAAVTSGRFTRVAPAGAIRAFVAPGATQLPLLHTGLADVSLLFLCTIRPAGSETCLSIFTYENGKGAQIVAAAGTPANSVSTAIDGDAGQAEAFLPGVHFGAASVLWNCEANEAMTWTLQTGRGTSVASAAAAAVPCPSITDLV